MGSPEMVDESQQPAENMVMNSKSAQDDNGLHTPGPAGVRQENDASARGDEHTVGLAVRQFRRPGVEGHVERAGLPVADAHNDANESLNPASQLEGATYPPHPQPSLPPPPSLYGRLIYDGKQAAQQEPQHQQAQQQQQGPQPSDPSTSTMPRRTTKKKQKKPSQNHARVAQTASYAPKPSERANKSDLMDRHQRAMAQILTRFRNMVMAATEPLPRTAIIEHAVLNRMTMETETRALITEVEGLLSLTREIKVLWMRGSLRQPGEDDSREAEIDQKAFAVQELYRQLMVMKNRSSEMKKDDDDAKKKQQGGQEQEQQGNGGGNTA
ncbi:Uu.00g056770.m01.CDS01 [Anthostomella pinea]|uniref:Uu.00g056770.m01.CDS01 n=1 Tax=Anthostomella pinea TaxID=933095 RepID=A0AAI8VSQ3_9PEZI|nr:Uu.00g056770.m01.CDS01 [Anthostomella pinea]